MTSIYRISGRAYAIDDPTGAALSSEGRWHRKGQRVLYFSATLSTCILELRANGVSYRTIREKNHYCEANLAEDCSIEEVPVSFYADGWQGKKEFSQDFGSEWYLQKRSLILVVKSAALPFEKNFVINTSHPEFGRMTFPEALPIELDSRLVD